MHSTRRCVAVLFLLFAWTLPVASTLGAAIHLATNHADHGHHRHQPAAAEVALALVHGHHHDHAVPAHEHESPGTDGSTPATSATSAGASHPASLSSPIAPCAAPAILAPHGLRSHPPPASAPPLRL